MVATSDFCGHGRGLEANHRDHLAEFCRFMDYVLTLPAPLSRPFHREPENLEEQLKMPYVTSLEQIARQEGIEQGRQQGIEQGRPEGRQEGREEGRREGVRQGARELLRQTLEARFGGLPDSLRHKVEQCQDVAALRAFHQQALTARSVDDVIRCIPFIPSSLGSMGDGMNGTTRMVDTCRLPVFLA